VPGGDNQLMNNGKWKNRRRAGFVTGVSMTIKADPDRFQNASTNSLEPF
jgi:hypothetical protein